MSAPDLGFTMRGRLAVLTSLLSIAAAGCGGGADTAPPSGPVATTIAYPQSVVLGAPAPQALLYVASQGSQPASVTATAASPLLAAGPTPLLAEHLEAGLPGLRVACVSGRGDSTNVISNINLGVISESAAVLLDGGWRPVDAAVAWSRAVASGAAWLGWENCGVKPEGPPSPSSRLVPGADGGYAEDVYDGNPGTTFNVVRRVVSSADTAALLSAAGLANLDDPLRPLQLTLRAFSDAAGQIVFIEMGTPLAGAPVSARGFIALYVPE
jgi:hypothetical protein